jgi:hypothetical protein
MLFPGEIMLTRPWIMSILPLFPLLPSLMPSISLSFVTSNFPQHLIPLFFGQFRIYQKKLPCFPAQHWPTGHSKTATCITSIAYTFPHQHAPLYSTLYICHLSLVTLDVSAPRQSSNVISGGRASPPLSLTCHGVCRVPTEQSPNSPGHASTQSHQIYHFSSIQTTFCRPCHRSSPFQRT